MKRILLAIGFMLAATAAHAQAPCDLNATTANFVTQLAATQPGQTLCLASGNYGSFNGATKNGLIHIQAAVGATVSFSGGNIGSTTRNIYIHAPITWTGPVEIAPGAGGLNFWIEGTWANVGHSTHEGRVSISCSSGCGASGVHIMNSKFGPGGCSDGIQISAPGVEVGFSEFTGILQGSCSEHVDPIQLYGGDQANIHDVWMHENDQGIMAPDGSTGTIIKNSVIAAGNNYDLVLGDIHDATITNNVADADVYDGNPTDQPGCSAKKSSNVVYQNNVGTMAGCGTNITNTNNQSSGVTFVGGAGRCGFATKSPTGTGTNGTTIGLNDCGTPPPPAIAVTVAPPSATKLVNSTQQFSATVTGTTNTAVTWTATCGTVSASGLFTAPSTAMNCNVRATSVADTSKFGIATVTVTATPPPVGCVVSTTSFINTSFAAQTGTFTVDFDATPSAQTMDAVFGLSNGPATSYDSNAVATRFVSSGIEARSGDNYVPIPNATFTAGATYHFKIVVRRASHNYDVYVNAVGSGTVNSITNLAFRTQQASVAQLNNWSTISIQGTQQICNFTLSVTPPPASLSMTCTGLVCTLVSTGNPAGTSFPVTATGPNGQTASATAHN